MTGLATARGRNGALGLLFAVVVLNVFDRQIINVLAQDIKRELLLSDAKLGLLTGTAFGIFYSVLGIPLGRLADRVDRVKLIAVSLIIWSGFTVLCGLAASYVQLFLARMAVGVGEAGSQPASTALIPDLFSDNRRTWALSMMLVGVPVGSFLGLLVGGLVASMWGWRAAFAISGISGLLLAFVMMATLKDPRSYPSAPPDKRSSLPGTLLMLARRPAFLWITSGMICSTFLIYASGAWLPPFFIRIYRMTTAQIGCCAAIAVGLGGAIGTLGAGLVCDRLRRRTRNIEAKVLVVALILVVPTLVGTVLASNRTIALVSMFLFNVCAFAWLGPTVTLVQRAATPETRALSVAASMSAANIVSLGCGLPLVGLLSDILTPSHGPEAIRYALAACAAAGLLGAFAYWRASLATARIAR